MTIYPQKQDIKIERGDDYREVFHLGVDLTGADVVFTLKTSKYLEDVDARVQVTLSGGLVILNGAPAINPANGAIVIQSVSAGTIELWLSHEVTEVLTTSTGVWFYDFQVEQP